MHYIDVEQLFTKFIALYCRVSTAGQDILKQITLAEICLLQGNVSINSVKRFIDDNVSANKLAAKDRPEFQRLLKEIHAGKVETLLVQNRDRLARNFYEYVELVKILHKFQVNVIFTDSGQPPFSQVLAIEALYGIFPQFDGRTNARRTQQTRMRYPNALLGFNVIGERKDKRYIPNPQKANTLRSFFYSVIDSQSPEDLISLFIKYKRFFDNNHQKALNCLQNPFYAGLLHYQDEYISLSHVEPIIPPEDFLQIQEKLVNYKQLLQDAIDRSSNNGIHIPFCHICKKPMKFRKTELGQSGNYVCSNKHSKVQIKVGLFNKLISDHLMDVLKRIEGKEIKKDVFSHLLQSEKHFKQELAFLQNKLCITQRDMTELIGSNKTAALKMLVAQVKSIKEEMMNLKMLLEKISYARREINAFTSIVKNRISEELLDYQIEYVSKILFSKIEVSADALIYHTAFANYIEGEDFSNEY